jgi:hypothetical protein
LEVTSGPERAAGARRVQGPEIDEFILSHWKQGREDGGRGRTRVGPIVRAAGPPAALTSVSQAIVHGLTILTPDPLVTQYQALTAW